MSFKDLMSQLLERGNAMQTFWGFYITIAFGLLAVISNTKSVQHLKSLATILSVAFLLFAAANYGGMSDVARQREFLFQQIRLAELSANAEQRPMIKSFELVSTPPSTEQVQRFHWAFDFLEIVALWGLVGLRLRSERVKPAVIPGI